METIKGFKDIVGEEAKKREKIRSILTKKFNLYGFEPAETPIIESEKLVKGDNSRDEAVSDVFKLKDKGKRALALRYEFTFQLKRIAKNKKLPYKRYQIGPVFRDEPAKPGRYRQFVQADVDIIGGSELVSDADILSLARDIFQELKIPIEIQLNNRKLLSSIVDKFVRDKKTEEQVIREVDKLDKNQSSAYKNLSELLGKIKTEELLEYFNKPLSFFVGQGFDGAEELKELQKICKGYGVKTIFVPSLARGLSYYTGNIFELTSSKSDYTITGGGRYDIDGVPAVGISFGLDRISEIAELEVERTKVLVISLKKDKESINLVNELRANDISTSIMYGKPTKALQYANSYKIPYVVLIGEEEIKKKKVKLKNMKTGRQSLVSEKDLIKKIK